MFFFFTDLACPLQDRCRRRSSPTNGCPASGQPPYLQCTSWIGFEGASEETPANLTRAPNVASVTAGRRASTCTCGKSVARSRSFTVPCAITALSRRVTLFRIFDIGMRKTWLLPKPLLRLNPSSADQELMALI